MTANKTTDHQPPFVSTFNCNKCSEPLGVINTSGYPHLLERSTGEVHICPIGRCTECNDGIVWVQATDGTWYAYNKTDGLPHQCWFAGPDVDLVQLTDWIH